MSAVEVDTDAFRRLYDGAKSEVYRYLRNRCSDQATAEDLTSEVFLRAMREWRAGRRDRVTVPWLLRVARNRLIDTWRAAESEKRRLSRFALDEQIELPPDAFEGVDADEVLVALAGLSAEHRTALTLKYMDGCSVVEVAAVMERSLEATTSLLARARRAMRVQLREMLDD